MFLNNFHYILLNYTSTLQHPDLLDYLLGYYLFCLFCSSATFYQDNKERLQIKAHEIYQSLSKDGNEEKQQYEFTSLMLILLGLVLLKLNSRES